MPVVKENYDVCIVGAGHAGCEAALACARLGLETILFTISIESVAMMPCTRISGAVPKDTWYAKLMRWAVKWVSISTIRLSSLKC